MALKMNPIDNKIYQFTLGCGGFPLCAGLLVFCTWLATRWQWLETAGLFVLFGGVVWFVIGVVALIIFIIQSRNSAMSRWKLWCSVVLSGSLLLLNFPAAFAIANAVIEIKTTYYLVIQNNSPTTVSGARVYGGGRDLQLQPIAPGSNFKTKMLFIRDGSLMLNIKSGGLETTNLVEGYVTKGIGGKTIVTLRPDGQIDVDQRR